jgi:peptidoglycan/xylan/chitin deacetylase (PgdA/CDA1 family)
MSKRLRVCLTVDVEQDCPPYRNSYLGIEQGMPALLDLLAQERLQATFFSTGDVARRFPKSIEALIEAGHELGCHGDTHRRFDDMNVVEAEADLRCATAALRSFSAAVTSFRAPNLAFPAAYLALLEDLDYRLDSSQGKHKIDYWRSASACRLQRVPASTTSSVLRCTRVLRNPFFSMLRDPVVLFVHPWEFVDWRHSTLRWDCRFRTGEPALECLLSSVEYFRRRGAEFVRMCDLEATP